MNPHNYFSLEIHGTEALLHYGSPTDQLSVSTSLADGAVKWETLEVPADGPTPFEHWVEHLLRETNVTRAINAENHQMGLDLTALMEAANRSAQTGQMCEVRP